eukprot:COSAG05_NODE_12340_length_472_cov_0.447721_1_plen_129_part_01
MERPLALHDSSIGSIGSIGSAAKGAAGRLPFATSSSSHWGETTRVGAGLSAPRGGRPEMQQGDGAGIGLAGPQPAWQQQHTQAQGGMQQQQQRQHACGEVYEAGFVFFKQKTAYEMESRDWSSDVCSSD